MATIPSPPRPPAGGGGDNLARLEAAYRRWSETKGGNVDEILALMDDAIVMDSVLSPDIPSEVAAAHYGRDQARTYFERLLAEWEMLGGEAERFIADADGEDIVMIGHCHWRHRASGREVSSPKVDIWRFKGGRATLFYELFDTLAFARAAGMV